jgi:hypothetical protein
MSFTEILFKHTYESHKIVDKHQFVSLIKDNKLASDLYILFNKMCINETQKVLKLQDINLQNKLHKKLENLEEESNNHPIILTSSSFNTLINHCKKYPLETEYMFKLGLMKGGNILKKYVDSCHHDFLTFINPNTLCNDFKHYLNTNIHPLEQESFIIHVNDAYKLIKLCFDDFFNSIK